LRNLTTDLLHAKCFDVGCDEGYPDTWIVKDPVFHWIASNLNRLGDGTMLNKNDQIYYLHGFSSSPGSKKGLFLKSKLAEENIDLRIPDMNKPDFEGLTITAQVDEMESQLESLPDGAMAHLIGSSMGALIATLVADRLPRSIGSLVLVAPAFKFVGRRLAMLAGTNIETWELNGWIPIRHYSDDQIHKLGYQLVEDAALYDFSSLSIRHPTRVLHGTADTVIPFAATEAWAAQHPEVEFVPIRDGTHDLAENIDDVWSHCKSFFLLDHSQSDRLP
jgi:uncharacterized protein